MSLLCVISSFKEGSKVSQNSSLAFFKGDSGHLGHTKRVSPVHAYSTDTERLGYYRNQAHRCSEDELFAAQRSGKYKYWGLCVVCHPVVHRVLPGMSAIVGLGW